MDKKAPQDKLNALHGDVARLLLKRLRGEEEQTIVTKDGEKLTLPVTPAASDFANAIKFLKDNGTEVDGEKDDVSQELLAELPVSDEAIEERRLKAV